MGFNVKGDPNNPTYKTRYVAKGFSQIEGVDCTETFSPTARIRDSSNPHADCSRRKPDPSPKGCKECLPPSTNRWRCLCNTTCWLHSRREVWKLNKSLYGLKQSGRNWHTMLHKYLLELNFNPSSADACLYIKRDNGETMILLIWVDDIIIAGSSNLAIDSIKQKLSSKFVFLDHSLESNSPNTKDVSPCLNQFTLKMC